MQLLRLSQSAVRAPEASGVHSHEVVGSESAKVNVGSRRSRRSGAPKMSGEALSSRALSEER